VYDKVLINGGNYKRDGFLASAGLRALLNDKTSASLSYEYELGRDYTRHTINISLLRNW
jgi:hypothetical protein